MSIKNSWFTACNPPATLHATQCCTVVCPQPHLGHHCLALYPPPRGHSYYMGPTSSTRLTPTPLGVPFLWSKHSTSTSPSSHTGWSPPAYVLGCLPRCARHTPHLPGAAASMPGDSGTGALCSFPRLCTEQSTNCHCPTPEYRAEKDFRGVFSNKHRELVPPFRTLTILTGVWIGINWSKTAAKSPTSVSLFLCSNFMFQNLFNGNDWELTKRLR